MWPQSQQVLLAVIIHLGGDRLGLLNAFQWLVAFGTLSALARRACATAAHVTPITEVDRVAIGDGQPGPIAKKIQDLYFQMITGRMPQYLDWLTPVFKDAAVAAKA